MVSPVIDTLVEGFTTLFYYSTMLEVNVVVKGDRARGDSHYSLHGRSNIGLIVP
jgi:hypothetical protein